MAAPAIVAIAGALFWVNARRYLPFFSDDGFISLRYAERFLGGDGLTWTDGERVEGYSNLLWVLGCAGIGATGLDLVTAARALGVASTLGVLGCLAYHFRPRGSLLEALPCAAACGVVAASGTMAVWSIGGLEQSLEALLVTAGYLAVMRALDEGEAAGPTLRRAGIVLGLGCLTRPDAALFVAPPLVVLVAYNRSWFGVVRAARLAAWAAVFPAAQLAFRVLYYGDWVPNTARAKLAFTPERLKAGAEYVNGAAAASLPLLVAGSVALGVCLLDARARMRVGMVVLAIAGWLSYVRLIGGDIFPAFRHTAVVVPLVAIVVGEGLRSLLATERRLGLAASGIALLACVSFHRLGRANPEIKRALHERWEWDAAVVGPFLERHFGKAGALLAVEAAGALPFYAKLPALDLLGLNDRTLARERPPDFGKGYIGHELGSGRYVRERAPDLIAFQNTVGTREPGYRSGRELVATRWFKERYELVRLAIERPASVEALLWVKKDGRAGGWRDSNGDLTIPAILLGGAGQHAVREHASGRLAVHVRPGAPIRANAVNLARGRYRARFDASGANARVVVTSRDANIRKIGDAASVVCGAERCLVDVTVETEAGTTNVFGIELARERS